MRSVERLENQRRAKEQEKAKLPPPEDDMEEEMNFPKFVAINSAKSIFDDSADKTFGGINTAPSVFDKHTAIKTNR